MRRLLTILSAVAIGSGAMAQGEAVLPHNNSESRVVGLRWVVGAALTPEG